MRLWVRPRVLIHLFFGFSRQHPPNAPGMFEFSLVFRSASSVWIHELGQVCSIHQGLPSASLRCWGCTPWHIICRTSCTNKSSIKCEKNIYRRQSWLKTCFLKKSSKKNYLSNYGSFTAGDKNLPAEIVDDYDLENVLSLLVRWLSRCKASKLVRRHQFD